MRRLWFSSEEAPADFSPTLHVAGVLCEVEGLYLFLQRGANTPHPLTWNIPGGKVEPGESFEAAAIREIEEEAGFILEEVAPLGAVYVRQEHDFLFHLFHSLLPERPAIQLDPIECHASRWVTLQEAMELPLIHGDTETIEYLSGKLHRQNECEEAGGNHKK